MQRSVLTIMFYFMLILACDKLHCQSDTSNVNWWYPLSYISPEKHWIEDSIGIVCVKYDSSTNEFRYGPHATHIKRKKWKITIPYDSSTCEQNKPYCECYWFGRFKKKRASQWIKNNFQCEYEYDDRTRSGLIWTVKIYSKSGEVLEVHKRVLIGYYTKIINLSCIEQRGTTNGYDPRYTFSGKERDEETGYSYFGARYYHPDLSIWLSVDPMADKYPGVSPYVYCGDNPVKYFDPNGTHIEVVENDNGTYTVQKGIVNNDKNIYVIDANGNRTGKVLGEMLTTNSFFGDDNIVVKNAVIDPNDNSGGVFLNGIKQSPPSLVCYAVNARSSTEETLYKYDFKSIGGISKLNHYRGMPIKNNKGETFFASARDIGNIAAGYVAGYNGLTWNDTRMFFDGYQTISNNGVKGLFSQWSQEGRTSRLAQKYGFDMGTYARQYQIGRAREMVPLLKR